MFGHRSPYTRVYGHRNPGEALDVTMKNVRTIKNKLKGIRERLNVEKKHVDEVHNQSGLAVGQVAATGASPSTNAPSGHQTVDITPAISQGLGADERTGNSLKFTGLNMKLSLIGQSACYTARRVRFTVVRVGCAGEPAAQTFLKMYDKNDLTSSTGNGDVYDLQAPMNYTTLKTMGIKVLARRTFYLPNQVYVGTSASGTSVKSHKTCSFSIKLQDVARYASDAATEPENFRYYMFIQSDVGNAGAQTITGRTDLPIITPSSGVEVRFQSRIWYVDN